MEATSSNDHMMHVFWHEGMLNHDTGKGVFDTGLDPGFLDVLEKHPENADRIKNIVSILRRGPISPHISWHLGRSAEIPELLSFHTAEYINELIEADGQGGKVICSGTFLNPGSLNASLLAAGTTLSAMKLILDGHGKLAYALVRPPGHHAQPTQSDGYCFLNNAGLAVQLALDSGCRKVAVIDIDVHYGNGTAEGFYQSDRVLTMSLHMNHGSWGPSHPQNGSIDELGEGDGFGYNLNVPLPNGTGDEGYEYAMIELVIPAINYFNPDMLVMAVGQDSSAGEKKKDFLYYLVKNIPWTLIHGEVFLRVPLCFKLLYSRTNQNETDQGRRWERDRQARGEDVVFGSLLKSGIMECLSSFCLPFQG